MPDAHSFGVGSIIVASHNKEGDQICPADQVGFIPSYENWREFVDAVERYYENTSADAIWESNKALMRKYPNMFGEV